MMIAAIVTARPGDRQARAVSAVRVGARASAAGAVPAEPARGLLCCVSAAGALVARA